MFSPIEGEGGDGGCGGVLLEAVADVSEYLCLDRVGEGVMVLNLIDSPEAEVGRCHCFLGPSGQLHDWDKESPRGLFQHLQS